MCNCQEQNINFYGNIVKNCAMCIFSENFNKNTQFLNLYIFAYLVRSIVILYFSCYNHFEAKNHKR